VTAVYNHLGQLFSKLVGATRGGGAKGKLCLMELGWFGLLGLSSREKKDNGFFLPGTGGNAEQLSSQVTARGEGGW